MLDLVVYSHLRWDFVIQRPQHLLARLAQHYRVLFFEEPCYHHRSTFIQRFTPCPNVEVLRPHTPILTGGFCEEQISALAPLLEEALRANMSHGCMRHGTAVGDRRLARAHRLRLHGRT